MAIATSAKDDVLKLIKELPGEATYEDIQYHIYVRQKIQRGLETLKRGETLTQEEFDKRLAKWLGV